MRDSNVELYRIIAMLLIVAHHLSIHSGMIDMASEMPSNINALLVNLFGMWGKIGINCYLMITGYYMCTSQISLRKWMKLLFWIWFYKATLNTFFVVSGYMDISMHTILRILLPIDRVGGRFASTFIIFYLFIPYLNIIIKNLTKEKFQMLLILMALVFIILPYFPVYVISMTYLTRFIFVYFFAAYMRLYAEDKKGKQFWGITSLLCICLSIGSVIIGTYTNLWTPFYFVIDTNALFALPTAITTFMFMKQVQLGQNKIINIIAGSCFGVLLIHDHNVIMQQWLWKETLHASDFMNLTSSMFIIRSIGIIFAVYSICTIVDIARYHIFEKPLFYVADKYLGKYKIWFNK